MATFELYLMRHGIAEDFDAKRMQSDADRALTPDGREKLQIQAAGMAKLDLGIAQVLVSPYLRAQQTAEIIAGKVAPMSPRETSEALVPHAPLAQLVEVLQRLAPAGNVLAVGHEPHLSAFAAWAFGAKSHVAIEVKKGGLIGVTVQRLDRQPLGMLICLIPPRVLRALT